MANIIDFSDALTNEGLLAKKYEELAGQTTNEDVKAQLNHLVKLSEEKMELVYKVMNDIPWFKED